MPVVPIENLRGEPNGRRCFTLVEMLVVIAIVSILLMLFLPVLARAKEKACESACKNNLKQIGAAIASYPDENNGYAIPCVFKVRLGDEDNYYSWIDYLYNSSAIAAGTAKCPAMNEEECFNPYGGQSADLPKFIEYASYTMNVIEKGAWSGADIVSNPSKSCGWGDGSTKPVNLKRAGDLSDKICITDSLKRKPEYSLTDSDVTRIKHYFETDHGMLPIDTGTERRDVGNHHSGGFNSLFGDGHAETMRESKPRQWVVVAE
ncbi:MAG: prepilin-type N-terminal cleavage/methylation domain-containing protein [Victivallales bacterium]